MKQDRSRYQNPLLDRYSSAEMVCIFSPQAKFRTWRRLWTALAESQLELGLPVTAEQVEELRSRVDDIDFEAADRREGITRHDVMSHVHAYGLQCPGAAGIIHLGATSAYVTDNTDLLQMREALNLLRRRLLQAVSPLAGFCREHAALPALGYTHLQPAQPVTVGKRAALWLQDLLLDHEDLEHRLATLRFRGVKGTTGTQASFLTLFKGDGEKVRELDARVTRKMGFESRYEVCGQTYPRKEDARILDWLAGIGRSGHRITNDLRLLQHLYEIEEPFESGQIGSSAMAYKRNPMRGERAASLSKYLMALPQGPGMTAATQFFERTLDDSAQKRIAVPEAFLAADAVLLLLRSVFAGLVVHPSVIQRRLEEELPFLATETILMEAVSRGADRQETHELIRVHAMEARRRILDEGAANDLLDRLAGDPGLPFERDDLEQLCEARAFTGRAAEQVQEFLRSRVDPLLETHREELEGDTEEPRV